MAKMTWGDPMGPVLEEMRRRNRHRENLQNQVYESQIQLNNAFRDYTRPESPAPSVNQPKVTKVIHNHFNIIINVDPNTSNEKITAMVEKLTTVVSRVNQ